MADKTLPLADVLATIGDELIKAEEYAKKRGRAVMQFEDCEVEFAVAIEGGGQAGIHVWVLELGGQVTRTNSHTVKVRFKNIPGQATQAAHLADEPAPPAQRQP